MTTLFQDLPFDAIQEVISWLPLGDVASMALLSKPFARLFRTSHSLWWKVHRRIFHEDVLNIPDGESFAWQVNHSKSLRLLNPSDPSFIHISVTSQNAYELFKVR